MAITTSTTECTKHDIYLPLFMVQIPQKTLARTGYDSDIWEQTISQMVNINFEESNVFDSFISLEQYRRILLRGAELFGEDYLIAFWARDIHPIHLGPIGQAIVSANTIGDSIDVLLKYIFVVAPAIKVETRSSCQDYILKCCSIYPMPQIRELYAELVIVTMVKTLLHLGVPANEIRVNFEHNQRRDSEFYLKHLKVAPQFSQSSTTVKCPIHYLSKINEGAFPLTHKQALRDCELLGQKLKRKKNVYQEVSHLLLEGCRDGIHYSLEEVAEKLHMSQRTVSRRLKEEKSCFRNLQSSARLELAKEQLETSDRAIKSICLDSGFTSMSAFSRSFRRQTNFTPSEYRRKFGSNARF